MDDTTSPSTGQGESGRCNRAAFIIDAQAYFHAVAEALEKARRSVLIVGWDIDSRIQLGTPGEGPRFYELLNRAVENNPDLHIHVLIWDFPLAYSMDREPLQTLFFPNKTHENIHFRLDSEMPLGSSHHQKVVVIDDAVAFTGGMDLTAGRWDTPEHKPDDPRRKKPGGEPYPPYHDVQMVVDGEPAAILGNMARKRWLWATDETLSAPEPVDEDAWPPSVEPDLRDETVTMALTVPRYRGRKERREVEAIYLDWIARARKTIFIENQYFTSTTIRDALLEKLKEEDCPKILIILPQMTTGLLEQLVMEPLQSSVLDELAEADTHGRLAVYSPFADTEAEVSIKVHSKLLVVDDELVTVGSANLNERSLGLDSECNLALTPNDADVVRRFRQELIAHHISVPMEEYVQLEGEVGMLEATAQLSGRTRRLRLERDTRHDAPLPVDPEMVRQLDISRPGEYDTALDDYSDDENSRISFARVAGFGLLLAVFIALALAWKFTPLSEYATTDQLLDWAEQVREMSLSPLLVVGCFVVGGFIMFPVTLLILLTASIFPPLVALAISLTGSLASALAVYLTGQILGQEPVKRLAGSKINTVSKQMGKHGLVSIMVARVVPLAPYSVVNLVAGASHIRLPVFLLGTGLGMGPGIVAMTLFGGQLINVLRDPGPGTIAILVGILALILVLGYFLKRRLRRMHDDTPEA